MNAGLDSEIITTTTTFLLTELFCVLS